MNFWLKTPLCTKWLLQLKTGSNCQQFRACGFDQFGNEEQNISQHKCLNAYLLVHVICPQFTSKLYEPQLNMQPYLIVSGLPWYFYRPVARLLHLLLLQYYGVLSKWDCFIKMRAAFLAPIHPWVMKERESKKAALILMKNSHLDRTLR